MAGISIPAMAKARRLEDQLRAAEGLRRLPPGPEATAGIRAALAHPSGLVVAVGARAALAHRLDGEVPALLAALERLYDDPGERDPQCHGKLALATSLDELGCSDAAPFLRAVAYVQREPGFGGSHDSAAPLRIRAAQALLRLGHHDIYRILGDLLVDAIGDVRGAAAQLLGQIGGERAALLLRLRLRVAVGEADDAAEAMTDHAAALLICDGERSLPLVLGLLDDEDRTMAGGAALALGGSRLPAALEPLLGQLRRCHDRQLRRILVDAVALLRSEAAMTALLDLLRDGDDETALAAVNALRLYRDRQAVVERVGELLEKRGQPRLVREWERGV